MNKTQQTRQDANNRAISFCTDHDAELTPIDGYSDEKTALVEAIKDVNDAAQNQAPDTTVITIDKHIDKNDLAEIIHKYTLRGTFKAHQVHNIEIEAALDKPITFISQAPDNIAVTRSTDLKDIMKNNRVSILTNITQDNIDEMEAAISLFSGIKGKNKEAVTNKKATGTDPMDSLLDAADVPKDQIGRLVHSYLSPEAAHQWDLQTRVGKPAGTKHLNAIITYRDLDTNQIIQHIKAHLFNGSYSHNKFSTKIGTSRFLGVENGNYSLESKHPLYITDNRSGIAITDDDVPKITIKLKLK